MRNVRARLVATGIAVTALLGSVGGHAVAAVNESRAAIPARLANGLAMEDDLPFGDWLPPADGLSTEQQAMYVAASKLGWQRTWHTGDRSVRVYSLVVPSSFEYQAAPPTTVPVTTPDGLVELDKTRQVVSSDCSSSSSQTSSGTLSSTAKSSTAKSKSATTKKGSKAKAKQSETKRASSASSSSSDAVTTRDKASCTFDETVYGRAAPTAVVKRNDDGLGFADAVFHAQVRALQKSLQSVGSVGADVNVPKFAPPIGGTLPMRVVVLHRGRAIVTVVVNGPNAESTIDGIVKEVAATVDSAGVTFG